MIYEPKEWLIKYLKRLLKQEDNKFNPMNDYKPRRKLLVKTIKELEK